MAEATRTRTRKTQSEKLEKAEQEIADKKAREEAKAEKKAERESKKAEQEAEKVKAREEKQAAKEAERVAERQKLVDAGDLIEIPKGDHTVEYVRSTPKKETVADRAKAVIEELKEQGRETPVHGKYLADKYGGGTVQWVTLFGTLRVLGLVESYQYKTGTRGESGRAYRWIGD